ncbi:MAG: hypothetical protein Q9160_004472 [Pyrenula sp. 1 TL-2023]
MFSLALLACAVGLSSAIQITAPAGNSSVAAGTTTTLTWTSVDTDPTDFSVYLVNFVDWPPSYIGIAFNVQTSSGSAQVPIPCNTNPSYGYQLNAINGTNTYVIYSQSDKFSVSPSSPGCTDSNLPTPPGCGAAASTVTITATPSTCFASNSSTSGIDSPFPMPTPPLGTGSGPITDSGSSTLTNPLQTPPVPPPDSSAMNPSDSLGNSPSSLTSGSTDSTVTDVGSTPTLTPSTPDTSDSSSNSTGPSGGDSSSLLGSSNTDSPISQGAPVSYGTVPGTIGWSPTGYTNPVTINPPSPSSSAIIDSSSSSSSFNPGVSFGNGGNAAGIPAGTGVVPPDSNTTPPPALNTGGAGGGAAPPPSSTSVSPPISSFTGGAAAPRRTGGVVGWREVAALGGMVALVV